MGWQRHVRNGRPNLGNWLKMKVLAQVPELSAGVEMPFLTEGLTRAKKHVVIIGSESALKAVLMRKLERNTGVRI